MALVPGTRFGSYEVLSAIGAGGMGEVSRARDTKLGRDVALKVLPARFALDADRIARFTREAQVLASLNHPNVAAIYGFEESQDRTGHRVSALILELVDGPTLDERIVAGRLSINEALTIALQIARALEAAHELGIVHRDLKPSNIKVRPDGTVKVLDFGLAKLVEGGSHGAAGLADGQSQSPTVTSPAVTVTGVILGTASYMSPEQARGQSIDKRSDIWAFGCILYEMLTGIRAFRGETMSDVIAAVLAGEPAWNALPDTTPPRVRRVLRQCLERDYKHRRRDIADVALDLAAPESSPATTTQQPVRSRVNRVLALVAVVATGTALLLLTQRKAPSATQPEPPTSLTRVTSDDGFTADPALSRDAALVAYASDRGGDEQLDIWVQQTAGSTPIRVTRDTFDEREPSFSPDGSRIVFRSERDGGGIYVVPTFGSEAPRFLASGGRRPRFSPDGRQVAYWTGSNIGFTARAKSYRTFIVPVTGGEPREILPEMSAARFPVWSPDSKGLLVLASAATVPQPETYDWWFVPLDGGAPVATGASKITATLATGAPEAALANVAGTVGADDWIGTRLLFSNYDFLWSLELDPVSHAAIGPPQRLTFGTNHDAQAVASADGTIVFSSAAYVNTVYGIPLDTARGVVTGSPVRLTNGIAYDARPSSTADGGRIAYRSSTSKTIAIVRNLADNRVVDLGIRPSNFGPAISPDGTWVAFETSGGIDIVPSGGGPSRTLCRDCGIGDWSEDSTGLAITRKGRLSLVNVASAAIEDLAVGNDLNRPFVSPNGRLIAFRAGEDGLSRVFVAPRDSGGPVSRDRWIALDQAEPDTRPAGWSRDGALIYFVSSRDGVRCLYAVRIDSATGVPRGGTMLVRHFHGTRNAWAGTTGVLSTGPANAVRGGRFIYDIATFSSNIWLMGTRASASKETR